jgi:spore maturation protein CgeB
VTSHAVNNLKRDKVCDRVYMLPFSVDTNTYRQIPNVNKVIDVLAVFTVRDDVYPNRKRVVKLLESMKELRILTKRVIRTQLVKTINASKIIITSNNIYNSLSMRYTETLACGGFLLADEPEDIDILGFVDGRHLVLYKDLKDLRDKIQYYLKHDRERERIAKRGMDLVRKHHSCKRRVREFTNIVKRELF